MGHSQDTWHCLESGLLTPWGSPASLAPAVAEVRACGSLYMGCTHQKWTKPPNPQISPLTSRPALETRKYTTCPGHAARISHMAQAAWLHRPYLGTVLGLPQSPSLMNPDLSSSPRVLPVQQPLQCPCMGCGAALTFLRDCFLQALSCSSSHQPRLSR
jgi:hypothetical protein